jgi:Spy/CpxP family protein refolding chaperone
MRIQSKFALALLSLALVLPEAHAQRQEQNDPPGPPSAFDRGPGHNGREGRDGRSDMRGRGEGHRGDREFRLARLVTNPEIRERLGVTPEQAAKIRQQTADFRKSEIRGRADLQIKRIELRELLGADNPDRAASDRKLQEIGAARTAREKSAIDFHLAMRTALTPEQRQKLQQMREEFRHRRDRGPRGERGPDGRGPRRQPQAAPPAGNPPGEGEE